MIDGIKKDCETKMTRSVESLQLELAKLRSGRAHPSLLDHILVQSYGKDVPLNQVASVTVADARTLLVSPWDKNVAVAVEKAIRISELGLNPATQGNVIRVPLPAMTEERRKEMVKIVKSEAENSRVSIRNIRRDAMTQLKDALKDKKISEDEEKRAQDVIQKLTDKFVADVEKHLAAKEKELMEI